MTTEPSTLAIPPRPAPRLRALTSLRFFAAAMVVIHHIKADYPALDAALPASFNFASGVPFFFMLSGFILTYNYPSLPTRESRWRFLVARFARLWPAHMTALIFAFVIAPGYITYLMPWSPAMAGHFILTAAMVQTWIPLTWMSISFNDPNWSIATEFAFYFAFLFLISSFNRTWWWKLVLSGIVVAVTIQLCSVFHIPQPTSREDGLTDYSLIYLWPVVRLLEFVIGMCTALVWRKYGAQVAGRPVLWTVLEIAALMLFAFHKQSGFALLRFLPITRTAAFGLWFITSGCLLIPASVLIFVMACGAGWISRAISIPPLLFAGEISYSIYLLHWPLLRSDLHNLPQVTAQPKWLDVSVTIAVLLALSCLVWAYIEVPGRRYILNRAMARRPAA